MPRHDSSSDSEGDFGSRMVGRERERSRDRDRDRDRDMERSSRRDRSRDREREGDKVRDRDREKSRERSIRQDMSRDGDREGDGDRDRDKYMDRDKERKRSRSPSSSSSSDSDRKKDKKSKKERKKKKKEKKRAKKMSEKSNGGSGSTGGCSGTTFEERMQSLRALAVERPERSQPPPPPPPLPAKARSSSPPPPTPAPAQPTKDVRAEAVVTAVSKAPETVAGDDGQNKKFSLASHKGIGEAPKPVAAHGAAMTLDQWRAMTQARPELAAVSKGLNASNEESIKPKEKEEANDGEKKPDSSKDWACQSRTCNGHINFRKADKCNKCGAIRRMGQGSYKPPKDAPVVQARNKNLMF